MSTELPIPIMQADLTPLNRIRVETALSRYPIHRIAGKGIVTINLQRDTELKWEVTYNSKFGQPGPLAYKLDKLIINRRLDELSRPLPELFKLGSLSDVCRALSCADTGPNIANVKRAFLQNAFTAINAKFRYRMKNGREKWSELAYTRYGVVFAGEKLPDGRQADAVYIVLNPIHRELLNDVEIRPLDYEYLKELSPGPQRLYELLSFQVYGAIASGRPRAKILYSDYCDRAPQARYTDFNHVKKQMYKLHVPHREFGYIVKVEYEEVTNAAGEPDWEIFYTPGPKALAEYRVFTNKTAVLPAAPSTAFAKTKASSEHAPVQTMLDLTTIDTGLLEEMTRRGITDRKARYLLADLKPGQEVLGQLEYTDYLIAAAPSGKFRNPPGLYIRNVEQNLAVPASFETSRHRKLRESAHQAKNLAAARRAQLEMDYDEYRRDEIERYIAEMLPRDEYERLHQDILRQYRGTFKQMTKDQLEDIARGAVAAELKDSGRVPLLSFEAFCRQKSHVTHLE